MTQVSLFCFISLFPAARTVRGGAFPAGIILFIGGVIEGYFIKCSLSVYGGGGRRGGALQCALHRVCVPPLPST